MEDLGPEPHPGSAAGAKGRASDVGVMGRQADENTALATEAQAGARRKTLTGATPRKHSELPGMTPSKEKLRLGHAASHYFEMSHSKKSSKKNGNNTSMSMLGNESILNMTGESVDELELDSILKDTSMLSRASSSSGDSSSAPGNLNTSVLSDTTDLTASNFILTTASKQMFDEYTKSAKKASKEAKVAAEEEKKAAEVEAAAIEVASSQSSVSKKAPPSSSNNDDDVSDDVKSTKENKAENGAEQPKEEVKPSSRPALSSIDKPEGSQKSPDSRRLSLTGSSPSLRTSLKTTPESLRKLTEKLKSQRLARQADQEEYKRRLSMGSQDSVIVRHAAGAKPGEASAQRNRLPPPFTQPSVPSSPEEPLTQESQQSVKTNPTPQSKAETAETVSVGALEDLFAAPASKSKRDSSLSSSTKGGPKSAFESEFGNFDCTDGASYKISRRSSTGSTLSLFSPAKQVAKAKSPTSANVSVAEKQGPVEAKKSPSATETPGVPMSIEFDASQPSPKVDTPASVAAPVAEASLTVKPSEEFSSPPRSVKSTASATGFRLTPSSRKTLTPSRLSSKSPRRIPNPKSLDSPAKNTRSARRQSTADLSDADSSAASSLMGAFGETFKDDKKPSGDDTASLSGLSALLKNEPRRETMASIATMSLLSKSNVSSSRDSMSPASKVSNGNDTASIGGLSALLELPPSQPTEDVSVVSSVFSKKQLSVTSKTMDEEDRTQKEDTEETEQKEVPSPISNKAEDHTEQRPEEYPKVAEEGTPSSRYGITEDGSPQPSPAMTTKGPDSSKFSDTPVIEESSDQQGPPMTPPSIKRHPATSPARSATKSPFRIKPNSHTKLKNTEIEPSPRRVRNIKAIVDSPARRTRSAMKKLEEENEDKNPIEPKHLELSQEADSPAKTTANDSEVLASSFRQSPVAVDLVVGAGDGVSPQSQSKESVAEASTENLSQVMHSPVRGTRSATKRAQEESSASKESLSQVVHSPARGTRSATKKAQEESPASKESLSQVMHSPARGTRSATKKAQEESAIKETLSQVMHSPARGTRSATKKAHEEQLKAISSPTSGEKRGSIGVFSQVEDVGVAKQLGPKRRKSMTPAQSRLTIDGNTFDSARSPAPPRSKQHGILSAMKKKTSLESSDGKASRSVAFGSPEVAEYNVGSPSVNYTPLPAKEAKKMYLIPKDASGSSSDGSVSFNKTTEIESDLNMLVDNMKVDEMNGSPALSPIENARDETAPFHLSSGSYNINLSKSTEKSQIDTSASLSQQQLTEDSTVDLETGIDQLLTNAVENQGARAVTAIPTSQDESQNVSQAEDQSNTISTFGSTMQIDDSATVNEIALSGQVEATVELEDNITDVLQNAFDSKPTAKIANDSQEDSVEMVDARSIASVNSNADKFTADLTGAIGGQKLFNTQEFSISSPGNDSIESMEIDEGNTVELEGNMASLLAEAVNKKSSSQTQTEEPETLSIRHSEVCGHNEESEKNENDDGLVFDVSDSPVSTGKESELKRPRSSLASRRYSLAPTGRLSLSHTGEVKLNDDRAIFETEPAQKLEESVSASPSASDQGASTVKSDGSVDELSVELTLDTEGVLELANIDKEAIANDQVDPIASFTKEAKGIQCEPLGEALGQYVDAVCGEVEARTESEEALQDYLPMMLEENPDAFRSLQKNLQSSESNAVKTELLRLTASVSSTVEDEWNKWISVVVQSLQNPVGSVISSLESDSDVLEQATSSCDEAEGEFLKMETRAAQRARRKSVARRVVSHIILHILLQIFFKSILSMLLTPSYTQIFQPSNFIIIRTLRRLWKRKFKTSRISLKLPRLP